MFTLVRRMSPKKDETTGDHLLCAAAARPGRVSKRDVIEHIEKHCTVTGADAKGALDALEYQIGEALKNGRSVRLGDLGSFRPVVKNAQPLTEDPTLLSGADVRCVAVRFTPSTKLRNALKKGNGIEFGFVD